MLVRAVLTPERAHDSKLREGRRPAEHGNEAFVFLRAQSMFRDKCGRDDGIAGTRSNGHGVLGAGLAVGFDTGGGPLVLGAGFAPVRGAGAARISSRLTGILGRVSFGAVGFRRLRDAAVSRSVRGSPAIPGFW